MNWSEKMRAGAKPRIAVVGAGVAGITASYMLQDKYAVTLFEKEARLGGHTHTVVVEDGPDAGTPVDTGFIVLNNRTYPLLHRFLERLQVPVRDADMSFGYWDPATNFQYSGRGFRGLFAQPGNLASPRMWSLMRDFMRFNKQGREMMAVSGGELVADALGPWLEKNGYGKIFRDDYLVPMGASIWSTSNEEMLEFPVGVFLEFFRNHGLLSVADRPQWQTVVGGSGSYVRAFHAQFPGEVVLDAGVKAVRRDSNGVSIHLGTGDVRRFDAVVMAVHADQVLGLLGDADEREQSLFAPWKYQENVVHLHTDSSVLPPRPWAHASWNFCREAGQAGRNPVSIAYDMNRLQGLRTQKHYLVSLNRRAELAPGSVLREIVYHHPTFTPTTVGTRPGILAGNGLRNTFFTGSYFGYGFHEDAVRASVELMEKHFGVNL